MDVLKTLPAEHYHACFTSPPYWSLRDYEIDTAVWCGSWGGGDPCLDARGHGWIRQVDRPQGEWCGHCNAWRGCLGLEPSPEMFYENMVTVFRELRRVMRKDGTVWVNMGDSFWGPRSFEGDEEGTDGVFARKSKRLAGARKWEFPKHHEFLRDKDLVMQPGRLADALQRDGWYVRMDNVWAKPNTMPGSAGDRPNKAHEYVHLLTREPRYFYDADAVREAWTSDRDDMRTKGLRTGKAYLNQKGAASNSKKPKKGEEPEEKTEKEEVPTVLTGRNLRSVWFPETIWKIPAKGFVSPLGEHFATFPPALPLKGILAGTSAKGCCGACGAPYERIVEKGEPDLEHQQACGGSKEDGSYDGKAKKKGYKKAGAQDPSEVKARILAGMRERKTVGWQATCKCEGAEIVPCRVIDIFCGTGTTGEQSRVEGRDFTGIEINEDTVLIAEDRIRCAFQQRVKRPSKPDVAQASLFGGPASEEK